MSFFESQPKIFWKGRFVDICGDGFWNSHHGAQLFCKKLGYASGIIEVHSSVAPQPMVDALKVMQCSSESAGLLDCSGSYAVQPKRECTQNYYYKIVCSGGSNAKEASCKAPGRGVSTLGAIVIRFLSHLRDLRPLRGEGVNS